MWYILLIILIVATMGFGFSKCRNDLNTSSNQSNKLPNDTIRKVLTRTEIIEKLNILAKSPPPSNLSYGAKCYSPKIPSDVYSYICPICGNKTLYKKEIALYLDQELLQCRKIAEKIESIDFKIDESLYCRSCTPNCQNPQLVGLIKYKDELEYRRICPIYYEDIVILKEFLNGSDVHKEFNDREIPLKNFIPRLNVLLGIK